MFAIVWPISHKKLTLVWLNTFRETFIRIKRKKFGVLPNSGGGGGGTLRPNFSGYFQFFPEGKNLYCFKMIYMLWNMKKINIFYPIMTPPSIPFPSASEPKNLSLEDLKEKNRPLVSYRIHFITCRLIFQKI